MPGIDDAQGQRAGESANRESESGPNVAFSDGPVLAPTAGTSTRFITGSFTRYLVAVVAVVLALLIREALAQRYGELPPYVTFYPVVFLTAMLAGVWAGLLATGCSALVVTYWMLPPIGQFAISRTSDVIGLAIFCTMGICVSVVAELYQRNRTKLAAYQKEEAVRDERRKADEARKVAEVIHAEHQRFLDVLETLPAMVCLLTPDYHVAFANRSFRERFGESRGRRCYEYCFGRSEPCEFCETYKVLKTGQPHRWEVTGPDGSVIDAYDFPFTDADGSPLILEMDIDITERRRAEAELEKYRQHLEDLVQERTSQLGTANTQLQAENTQRKRSEAELHKLNRMLTAYSHSTQALLRGESEPALLDWICRIVTEDCGYAMVWIGFAENDTNKSLRPMAHAGFDEGYLDLAGVSWAENERGSGPGGMAIRTGQPSACRNMLTDPQFEPWRKDALKRGYASSLVLPLIFPSTHSAAASAGGPDLPCGKVFGALTIYSKEVDPFTADEVKLLSDLAADLAYGIGAARLRVSHAQAEEALLRSEKLASVGRMAATIAHEINNPLESVMNLLFLANSATDLPESVRQYLETADAELKRVAHIARQSLGFYREGTVPARTSIVAVLDSTLDLLKSKITAKHAIIEEQCDNDVQITTVAGELRQVFSNLLANSLDAIDEKGTITLRVSTGTTFRYGPRCVRVTIADNGKGISATARQRIFEPFFTTKETVGTGLGLWVSKQIVDKHGGNIRVRSSTSGSRRGTTVSIFLPAQPAARSQSAGA